MSTSRQPKARYRDDYRAPSFSISKVELDIDLHDHKTRVQNTMLVRAEQDSNEPLILQGENILLISVAIDGKPLDKPDYEQRDGELILTGLPQHFELSIVTEVDPAHNTTLEGLYKSSGTFCTQCEAEGFRRITYFLDRPDVLSVYTTTIHGDQEKYPYLLSNGNPIEAGEEVGGRHFVTWHDPHPKPCYLFALVAGDFDRLDDMYVTQDGREVKLQLFVDKGNLQRAQFAMRSLKNAMKWDEERFNLTYDLDIYMIVAVDFFNMGAMENKGLNIFNAKYVLADPSAATDQDFLNVESVIGHEYFHNWTGNRITCRDWFQLSLKEGLTVFRDQEFSSDLGMRAVNRIQDARIIRTHQFEEDASPMAHPIRPDKVVEMNNFYTVTVYNKGAEVIRMMHTLLGEDGFQRGMSMYIKRHDGQAVTCEDFVVAMEDANGIDLSQFRHWYEQAGTPVVSVRTNFDAEQGSFVIALEQSTPPTPGQPTKQPFHIPIKAECYSASGQVIPLSSDVPSDAQGGVIELTEVNQELTITGLDEEPILGLLADFSAPVKLDYPCSEDSLIQLIGYGQDPFLRWDAVQQIYSRSIKAAIANEADVELPESLLQVLADNLTDSDSDPAMTALLLQTPSQETMASEYDQIPVDGIARATEQLKELIAIALKKELLQAWQKSPETDYELSSESVSARMLGNTCLSFLAAFSDDPEISEKLVQQFRQADNMTLQFGALQAAVHNQHPAAEELLSAFAEHWAGHTLVMDKWLAVQATAPVHGVLEKVQGLTEHAAFDWSNPNRIYSLVASFTHNPGELHRADGASYDWLFEVIVKLNKQNPQVASRLISPLLKWRRLEPVRREKLRAHLLGLQQRDDLSSDLYEKVAQSLSE